MSYVQIDTIKYGNKPWDAANNTITTVGKLIKQLQQYPSDMPVILQTDRDVYSMVGIIKEKQEF